MGSTVSTRRWPRRVLVTAVMAAFLPMASVGCFGRFQIVRNVYQFNKKVSPDKWTQWIAFLVLNFIPVYGFAAWVDALVVNSIEFWTGKNPAMQAEGDHVRVVQAPDGSVVRFEPQPDDSVGVLLTRADGREWHFSLRREGESLAARSPDGTLLARVADRAGQPALVEGVLARAEAY